VTYCRSRWQARQLGLGVVAPEQLSHVGRAGQAEQPRAVHEAVGEAVGDLVRGEPLVLLQPEEQSRVHRPAAGRHHEPVEGSETHGGVDAAPVEHRGQRRAGTEVAGHDPAGARRQLLGAARGPRVGQTVEAVAAQRPAFPPPARQCVGVGRRRQGRVERRVEARDVRHVGQQPLGGVQAVQRLRLVQRRQLHQLPQAPLDSTTTGSTRSGPPCTIRWPTASTCGAASGRPS